MEAGKGIGGFSTSSEEYVESKFDLFSKAEYETGIKKIVTQTFRPISSTSSKGPFQFVIPADPEKFTNAESIRLHGKMRIKKEISRIFKNEIAHFCRNIYLFSTKCLASLFATHTLVWFSSFLFS